MIRTGMCAYQEERNNIFCKNFAFVVNEYDIKLDSLFENSNENIWDWAYF